MAKAFGRRIFFYSTEDPTRWQGLVGIDLATKPGKYRLVVKTHLSDGIWVTRHVLTVKAKEFPVTRLVVSSNYVTPPRAVGELIAREARQVADLFRVASPERLWGGAFVAPVPGRPTSSFGRVRVFNGRRRSQHRGTDFRAAEGTPVEAPNAGEVVLAADLYYSGITVILDHGWGLYSYLAHLSRLAVGEGERVDRGDVIGYVGATGRVTGPHLHWSVRLNSARVDPVSLLGVLSATPRAPPGCNPADECGVSNQLGLAFLAIRHELATPD